MDGIDELVSELLLGLKDDSVSVVAELCEGQFGVSLSCEFGAVPYPIHFGISLGRGAGDDLSCRVGCGGDDAIGFDAGVAEQCVAHRFESAADGANCWVT